jgi:hypothetical protein
MIQPLLSNPSTYGSFCGRNLVIVTRRRYFLAVCRHTKFKNKMLRRSPLIASQGERDPRASPKTMA